MTREKILEYMILMVDDTTPVWVRRQYHDKAVKLLVNYNGSDFQTLFDEFEFKERFVESKEKVVEWKEDCRGI